LYQSQQQQYASLQGINQIHTQTQARLQDNLLYQTTGSGSIFIENVEAATRLLRKLGTSPTSEAGKEAATPTTGQVLMFDDNNIAIEVEWNELRKHLVLRRVSGDATQYTNICQQLMSNIL
jgi:hypothetical protein